MWYSFKDKPKNMSRILVSIGGYTQSSVWIYIEGKFYSDTECERILVDLIERESLQEVSKWMYLPLSEKDKI